jgi:nitric oxide reductase subunit C
MFIDHYLYGQFLKLTKVKDMGFSILYILQVIYINREIAMATRFTKSMARNIFFGGSLFFFLLFLALTFDTNQKLPKRDNSQNLTASVIHGKKLWEVNNCIGCHTLLGEGAYFAPELGNVYVRRGPDFIKAWIKAQPTGAPGRRQMPQFNFTEQELEDLVQFLKYTSEINTNNWPPNIEG